MKRRLPEPVRTAEPMPALLRGPLGAHMAAVYDPDGPVPDHVVSPMTTGPPDVQLAGWRWCTAFRRANDERQAWLCEHGYTDSKRHVDWHRFRAEQPGSGVAP